MLEHYKQRTFFNTDGNLVSARYELYKPSLYKQVTVERPMTLDELSLKYYNTPLLYWAIGEFNQIEDPFKKIEKGTIIKIPAV